MRILIVAATVLEIRPFLKKLNPLGKAEGRVSHYQLKDTQIDVLITGIGMMQTAYCLGKQISASTYDLAINAGICGSYREDLSIGEMVHVMEDCVPEMGSEEGEEFLSLFEIGLMDPDKSPFDQGRLINRSSVKSKHLSKLKVVRGATGKNAITGRSKLHC